MLTQAPSKILRAFLVRVLVDLSNREYLCRLKFLMVDVVKLMSAAFCSVSYERKNRFLFFLLKFSLIKFFVSQLCFSSGKLHQTDTI
jgi:hypothetical protein